MGGNDGRYIQQGYDRHVADLNPDGHSRGGRPNLVSVMERNDLDEFLAIAAGAVYSHMFSLLNLRHDRGEIRAFSLVVGR